MDRKYSDGAITNNKLYAIYYLALLALTFLLSKPDVEYGMTLRYSYMIAVVAPILFNKSYIPFVLPLFWGISQASFTPLLPTSKIYLSPTVSPLIFEALLNNPELYIVAPSSEKESFKLFLP